MYLCHYTCLYVGMSVVVWLCVVCTVCMFGLDVECVLLVFPCSVVRESLRQRVSLCLSSSVVLRERTAQVSVSVCTHIFTCVFLSMLVVVFVEFIVYLWVCVSVYQVSVCRGVRVHTRLSVNCFKEEYPYM